MPPPIDHKATAVTACLSQTVYIFAHFASSPTSSQHVPRMPRTCTFTLSPRRLLAQQQRQPHARGDSGQYQQPTKLGIPARALQHLPSMGSTAHAVDLRAPAAAARPERGVRGVRSATALRKPHRRAVALHPKQSHGADHQHLVRQSRTRAADDCPEPRRRR